ncbi:MAG TPA: ribbon-helix-helix domain-containing protein [Vicinamibacteria bacterium]|nr:ribbon-helix-helix domain-containing protein [Vicinamibacteria bacterium]
MASQVTVRLPEDLMKSLEAASEQMNVKASEIVRMALREFLRAPGRPGRRVADRVRGLIGSLESGLPDLAEKHRKYILESLKNGG